MLRGIGVIPGRLNKMFKTMLVRFLLQIPLIYVMVEGVASLQGGELTWQGLLVGFILLAMYDLGDFLQRTSVYDRDQE